jgi:hypothetical protein
MAGETSAPRTVHAWELHAGDRIVMPVPGEGPVEAVITEIRHEPGQPDELDWEACDHHCHGCLHYSAADLVSRLHACTIAVAA